MPTTYTGTQRKLVLAFDVGTTFSGISYTFLTPGEVPRISGVNRFPAQENVGGDSKIPTIVYYDQDGHPRAMGAEALDPRNEELADDEGWEKVEWFKMHLRPKSMGSTIDGTKIPPLPKGKRVVDVFADFMRYLYTCARTYVIETHAAGEVLWKSVEESDNIHFILTHPNGWQGPQQTRMRKSAVLAGLVSDTPEGRSRVQFVTEGEASLHFCVHSGLADSLIKLGNTVIIADAGGGTIDVSAYRFISVDPVKVEESAMPECKAQGSVFVSRRAHEYLQTFLCGSKYSSPEDIDAIAGIFDKTTKRIFRDQTEPSYVKFAAPKDKDIKFNIRNGQLKLDGTLVAGFFERSIQSILDVIEPLKTDVVQPVFLVGGFAASAWLFSQLQQRLAGLEFSVCRPDSHTNKAVADGAIYFHLDQVVTERVARTTLGINLATYYSETIEDHKRRFPTTYLDTAGDRLLPNRFSSVLNKGTLVSKTAEFRRAFSWTTDEKEKLSHGDIDILSYVGAKEDPGWIDEQPDDFVHYCTVEADLTNLVHTLQPLRSRKSNSQYYEINCVVVILFGLTETQAQLAWMENGVEKRSPATIIYGEPIMDEDEEVSVADEDLRDDDEEDSPVTEDEIPDLPEPDLKSEGINGLADDLGNSLVIDNIENQEHSAVTTPEPTPEKEHEHPGGAVSSGSPIKEEEKDEDWELA